MAVTTRVKINLSSGEVEVEGTQDFVEKQLTGLSELINSVKGQLEDKKAVQPTAVKKTVKPAPVKKAAPKKAAKPVKKAVKAAAPAAKKLSVPKLLKDWLSQFPEKLSQNDMVLLTGYFAQNSSEENKFGTGEISKYLRDMGVQVANAAGSLKQLANSSKIQLVLKKGKTNLYSISEKGEQYLNGLINRKK